MQKSIHVLFILAKVFSIVMAVVFLILAISSFTQAGSAPNAEAKGALIGSGVGNIINLVLACIAIFFAFTREGSIINADESSMKNCILSIVFGALGSCPFLVAASIVGLVYRSKKN